MGLVWYLVALGVLACLFGTGWLWARRMERDVDYDELRNDDDNERLKNTTRLAVGLSSSQWPQS